MNNIELVSQFEELIKQELEKGITQSEKEYIDLLFEKAVLFNAKKEVNDITGINVSSHYPEKYRGYCTKINNIHFNIHKAILLAMESAIDFNVPVDYIGYIKLALKSLIKLYIISTVELDGNESILLYHLYRIKANEKPIEERELFNEINNGQLELTESQFKVAMTTLQKMKIVSIDCGIITLKEKVIVKY